MSRIVSCGALPPRFTVTAHAGAFDTADNTLPSVQAALDFCCDTIEMDVSFRPDGTPVIIHKDDPGADEGVSLEDVFALIAKDPAITMNLDLKSVRNLPAVDALLRRYGLFERAFYTGVEADRTAQVKAQSAVPYFLNDTPGILQRGSRAGLQALADRIRTLGALGLNSYFKSVTPLCARVLHENGLLLSVWTANSEADIRHCLAVKPDNITSRHPDLVKNLIDALN